MGLGAWLSGPGGDILSSKDGELSNAAQGFRIGGTGSCDHARGFASVCADSQVESVAGQAWQNPGGKGRRVSAREGLQGFLEENSGSEGARRSFGQCALGSAIRAGQVGIVGEVEEQDRDLGQRYFP